MEPDQRWLSAFFKVMMILVAMIYFLACVILVMIAYRLLSLN